MRFNRYLTIFSFVALSLMPQAFAQSPSDASAQYFDVNMIIAKDGKSLGSPHSVVEVGHPAQISTSGNEDGGWKLKYTVVRSLVTTQGIPAAEFRAELFEKTSDGWILRMDPEITAQIGSAADLNLGKYEFKVTLNPISTEQITARYGAKVLQRGLTSCPADAPTASNSTNSSPAILASATPNTSSCCSGHCTDGSGSVFQCCGGVVCCVCGACCYINY